MRCYRHLSEDERDQIGIWRAAGRSVGAIARALGRAKATISDGPAPPGMRSAATGSCRSSAAATSDRHARPARPAPADQPAASHRWPAASCARRPDGEPDPNRAALAPPIPSGPGRSCWGRCRSPPRPPRCRHSQRRGLRSPPTGGARAHSGAGTKRRSVRESGWRRSSTPDSQIAAPRESDTQAGGPTTNSVISGRPLSQPRCAKANDRSGDTLNGLVTALDAPSPPSRDGAQSRS